MDENYQNYQGNSIKYRNAQNEQKEKPKVEAVVSNATMKKKSPIQSFIGALLAENISNIGHYLVFDVVAPAVKNAIFDIGNNTWAAIWGKTPSSQKTSSTTYHRAYTSQRAETKSYPIVTGNAYDYNEIIFETRADADTILTAMYDILDQYPTVAVADYYDLAGQVGNATDTKWGWKSINGSKVVALAGGGYTIRFPKAQPLD